MSGRPGIWTSALNAESAPLLSPRTAPVRFYDTTLRDGEQTVGVVLSPEQKLGIARHLDALGIARIEAGFPQVSREDQEAFQLIQGAGLRAEIWGFARCTAADVATLARLEAQAAILEVPASDIKLRAYGLTREDALSRATGAIGQARQAGIRVLFFPVDSTRADLEFLRQLYQAAREAGAEEAAIVDTLGACGPEATARLVAQVREWLGASVPLHFHGHNDFGLATACALAAVGAGAEWIQGTINGMGERAGNADLGEVALALHVLYGVPVDLNFSEIRTTSKFVREAAGYSLEAWKPVVGENLFVRESGAVASQFHTPEAIEPFTAALVGAPRRVVLGKKSGLDSIAIKAQELGLSVRADQRAGLLAAVKQQAVARRGLISDDEFRRLVADLAPQPTRP